MSILCTLVDVPTDLERETVNAILRNYNRLANPDYWSALDDAAKRARPMHVLARNEMGQVIGGLFGETQFAWLKIHVLCVQKNFRRSGIGSRMIHIAETEAIQRDCKYSFLDTMDFQAPGFYERCGYNIVGSIPDWDSHGHTKYFLTKQIRQQSLEAKQLPATTMHADLLGRLSLGRRSQV